MYGCLELISLRLAVLKNDLTSVQFFVCFVQLEFQNLYCFSHLK